MLTTSSFIVYNNSKIFSCTCITIPINYYNILHKCYTMLTYISELLKF
ncbi:hypothetical protein QGY_2130 [Clostridioides difficile 840]|nr:hypothetical protein QGY_2130 [Clostridioides difficile 840]